MEPFTPLRRLTIMQRMRWTWMLLGLVMGWTAVMPAWADDKAAPPASRWVAVLIAVVLVLGLALASVINPKRGHRD